MSRFPPKISLLCIHLLVFMYIMQLHLFFFFIKVYERAVGALGCGAVLGKVLLNPSSELSCQTGGLEPTAPSLPALGPSPDPAEPPQPGRIRLAGVPKPGTSKEQFGFAFGTRQATLLDAKI